jgi:hypothetical protein
VDEKEGRGRGTNVDEQKKKLTGLVPARVQFSVVDGVVVVQESAAIKKNVLLVLRRKPDHLIPHVSF